MNGERGCTIELKRKKTQALKIIGGLKKDGLVVETAEDGDVFGAKFAANPGGNLKPEKIAVVGEDGVLSGGSETKFQHALDVFGGETGDVVVDSGLVDVVLFRNDSPKNITERVSNSKLGGVTGEFVRDGTVIVGNVDFGEQSAGGAEGSMFVEKETTEKGMLGELQFEGESEAGLNPRPHRILRGSATDVGVVTTDGNGSVVNLKIIPKRKDADVVISVVVVGARLASEAHAGEGSKLGHDVGLQVEVIVNEVSGDGNTLHFLDFENDSFTALRLIKAGVIIAGVGHAGLAELLGPIGKILGGVTSVDENALVGFLFAHDALIFLDRT